MTLIGGQINESDEQVNEAIFRTKGSFAIDSKSLFEIDGVGVGLVGSADGWYDFINEEIYYTLNGTARFYITKGLDNISILNIKRVQELLILIKEINLELD